MTTARFFCEPVAPCCADRSTVGYLCTLPNGHVGAHQAWGVADDGPFDIWPQPKETTT